MWLFLSFVTGNNHARVPKAASCVGLKRVPESRFKRFLLAPYSPPSLFFSLFAVLFLGIVGTIIFSLFSAVHGGGGHFKKGWVSDPRVLCVCVCVQHTKLHAALSPLPPPFLFRWSPLLLRVGFGLCVTRARSPACRAVLALSAASFF